MATVLKPLTIDMINEGGFVEDLNADLQQLQRDHIAYCRRHGADSEKSVATLTVTIALRCENADDEVYSVVHQTVPKMPKRPAQASMVMVGENDAGEAVLFARASGSDESYPSQLKLSTKDGRVTVDKSGEPLDDAK